MKQSETKELIAQEYIHLQGVIESFDSKALTIKAWSITFSLTSIAAAYTSKNANILLIASFSALLFWLLEGSWKTFQYAYYKRTGQIEEYFREERKELKPMQITVSWYENWKKEGIKRLLRIMCWPHVALPHLIVFFAGLFLFYSASRSGSL
ncbi:MAG: hypothetical protein D3905_02455 [Candidatus Electrothrix sp. AS4_5]|nr:hypothetical protein [Candidatus Electrothrix gigas]MCI5188662.1 hypothetical protein [Candidatus Electrothrix gigas]